MPSSQSRHQSSRPRARRYDSESSISSSDDGGPKSSHRSTTKTQRPAPVERHDSDITGSDGSSYVDSSKHSEHSDTDDTEPSHQSKHSSSSKTKRAATLPVVAKQHQREYQHARQLTHRSRGYASDDDRDYRSRQRSSHHRRRSPSTSSSSSSSSDSDSESEEKKKIRAEQKAKVKAAIQAALTAGAVEAWRTRGDPGGMVNPKKIMRIAGAAIAAGGLDALMMQNGGHEQLAKMAEAIVGGLATSATLGGKITHRREGGAKGKAADSLIAIAAGKMMEKMGDGTLVSNHRRSKSLGPFHGRNRYGTHGGSGSHKK